ncbi:MAG: putative toxin-antitoxin system toxin component, PIN family [Candidatus Promineofilum sp.]|nr:putative toxin-antitoxin system toxin component, PIN family [Promineifilum sp.]MCW5861865.1 putative toxin-antitoxin system toxin component, PIN family [Anaerolineae bacterium]
MLRIVVDTNIWVRALMGGKVSLPVLQALQGNQFTLLVSKELLTELREVAQRPRLKKAIDDFDLQELLKLVALRGEIVDLKTVPPRCRDPKDEPVLATAIDGHADAIVTGDHDLRADDQLRKEMSAFGVQIWGVQSLIDALLEPE